MPRSCGARGNRSKMQRNDFAVPTRAPVLLGYYELEVQFSLRGDSRRKFVTMMQAAEPRHRNDFADRTCRFGSFATCWGLLLQP
jgi:hypothetical protein